MRQVPFRRTDGTSARPLCDVTSEKMTTRTRKTVSKDWVVRAEMFERLPQLMFDIASSSDESPRDRIAAAKMLVVMVQQEAARRKGEPASARPAVRIHLPDNGRAARRIGR